MLKRLICTLAACFALHVGAAAAQGFTVTITFDENCNGLFVNSAGFKEDLPCSLLDDPGPGGLAHAVTYDLLGPPGLTAGDLVLLEPGPGELAVLSDIIRFNPVGENGGFLVFYSDLSDGADALADIGFPNALYTNVLTRTEVGPEGANGFTYTPTEGQPGFVAGAGGPVTYVIISDTPAKLPEPGMVALLAIGFAGLLLQRRRRG